MYRSRSRKWSAIVTSVVCGIVGHARAQTAPGTINATAAPATSTGRTGNDVKQPARPITNNAPTDAASLMAKTGGSLLRASLALPPDVNQAKNSQLSFFAVPEPQPKTIKKHDLVTVVTREDSTFTSHGLSDLKREHDIEAKVDEFIKLRLGNFAIQGGAEGANPPGIRITGTRTFKGEATVDREDSMTDRITAEVLDVKPNGTLVVQARKQITFDEEEQQFILTGTCRAEDISADNTVLSTQLFDLQLQKKHKGSVRDTQKRGWFVALLDAISPF